MEVVCALQTGRTCLHIAGYHDNTDVFLYLGRKAGAKLEAKDNVRLFTMDVSHHMSVVL